MKQISGIFLLPFLAIFTGCGGPSSPPVDNNPSPPPVAISAADWDLLRNEMENHFRRAFDFFTVNDPTYCADEIRKGTLFLRTEAGRSADPVKSDLLNTASDLESLASTIESSSTTTSASLEQAFAKANLVLLQHHTLRVDAAYEAGDSLKAGRALRRAANCLERAYQWTGKTVSESSTAVINEARSISSNLCN